MAIEVKRYLQGIKIILLAAGAVVSAGDGAQWRVKCANEKATSEARGRITTKVFPPVSTHSFTAASQRELISII